MSQTRRKFLRFLGLSSLFIITSPKTFNLYNPRVLVDDDERLCREKFRIFVNAGIKDNALGDIITEIGKSFIDTEYVAGTLDTNPDSERLVTNLTGLDCVTFVENCLTFARCLKQNKTLFDDYKAELERIRYRDGVIDGYASRLHYFTDWIYNNQEKGVVRDISQEIGGVEYTKKIDFMSKHVNSYKQLADKKNLENIKTAEDAINSRTYYYVPKESISVVYSSLKNGDIIATTTTIVGLDVTHTGYVFKGDDGGTYFMHASLKSKKVIISDNQLQDYVMEDSKKTGIIVARPQEL
jgi:N-acetylmuramoyl-L-alanine amidase-like protein